jgi:hypothetical protein
MRFIAEACPSPQLVALHRPSSLAWEISRSDLIANLIAQYAEASWQYDIPIDLQYE